VNDERPGSRSGVLLPLAAAIWFISFTLYFFSQGLPNNSPWTRPDLWRESPWLILDSLLPPVPESGEPAPSSSGLRFIGQRFDKVAWAALVLIGSWHLGAVLLRVLLRGRSQSPPPAPGLHFALSGLAGLSAWSLYVLGFGLAGVLCRWIFGGSLLAFVVAEQLIERRHPSRHRILSSQTWSSLLGDTPRLAVICLAVMTPFLLAMTLGSLLPSTDFDVKAYHLVGPKEWFQSGQITFLDHNVYTSFPFLTEMLLLSTMVLSGDWWTGGIAGQLVLASFGPYAAIVVFHLASRFGRTAGWLASLIYLTTPWAVRISIIAYVEGALAAYLAATLATFLCSRDGTDGSLRWTALCGLFAGSTASCKYPGVISALIPFGLAVVIEGFRSSPGRRLQSAITRGVIFSAAGLAAFGPWLLKNLIQTGNPVYPLLWGLFDGKAFDADLNAKFKAGHALPVEILKNPLAWIPDLWRHVVDVFVGSDWQSPLMFGLAPAALALWWTMRRRTEERRASNDLAIILLDAAWLFLTWWALTHRIDRFWVPMLPILAVLSGIALQGIIAGARPLAAAVALMLAATTWYHLAFISSPFIGFNGYLMNEAAAGRIAEAPGMTIINSLPENSRTLLIGEAQVFEARRPVVYSTVFNHNVFEQLFAAEDGKSMKPAAEIRQILKDRGITHILVNWNEVLRYRTTYGYTDFVTPENVHQLETLGLVTPEPLPRTIPSVSRVAGKGDSTKFQLSTWGKSLIRKDADGEWYPGYELWRVND
jgi:4-amino-4-deoxy-L-arabinose transferase-like glycosyltransferase